MEPISPIDDDDSIRNIHGPGFFPPLEDIEGVEGLENILPSSSLSGVSSIEKSKEVVIPADVPTLNFPLLTPPSEELAVVAVASKDGNGINLVVEKGMSRLAQIGNDMVQNWSENLREINEYVLQILRSSQYLQIQQIMRNGSQILEVGRIGQVDQSPSSTSRVTSSTNVSSSDRTRLFERVPATAQIETSPPPPAPSKSSSILPLMASVLIGGGLAVGISHSTTSVSGVSSNPLVDAVKLAQEVQPVFTSMPLQDIVPLINLLVTAPIYYHSWNQAVSGGASHKDKQKMIETAKNFAEDVIRMVGDPSTMLKLIYRMQGSEKLTPQEKEGLANLLRFVMLGTALGVLYALEVGKMQGKQYRGIMPEEVRDLLFGHLAQPVGTASGKKFDRELTPMEQLSLNLAKLASMQLASLGPEDRIKAANTLLEYLEERKEVDHLLDPSKVFQDFYSAFTYHQPAPTQLS